MSPKKPQGVLARAEGATRHTALVVASGIVASLGGSAVMGWLLKWGHSLDSGGLVLAWHWLAARTWLWAILPSVGYLMGRIGLASPLSFAVTASLSGEVFELLVATAVGGLDSVFQSALDVVLRLATLMLGIALTAAMTGRGVKRAEARQRRAAAEAERRRGEYEELQRKSRAGDDQQ